MPVISLIWGFFDVGSYLQAVEHEQTYQEDLPGAYTGYLGSHLFSALVQGS